MSLLISRLMMIIKILTLTKIQFRIFLRKRAVYRFGENGRDLDAQNSLSVVVRLLLE